MLATFAFKISYVTSQNTASDNKANAEGTSGIQPPTKRTKQSADKTISAVAIVFSNMGDQTPHQYTTHTQTQQPPPTQPLRRISPI